MTSALKRKRGSGEAARLLNDSKSTLRYETSGSLSELFQPGWNSIGKRSNDLVPVNGANGMTEPKKQISNQSEDFHALMKTSREQERKVQESGVQSWKISQSIAGRLIHVD